MRARLLAQRSHGHLRSQASG